MIVLRFNSSAVEYVDPEALCWLLSRRVGSQLIMFLPHHPNTGAPFLEERAIAV